MSGMKAPGVARLEGYVGQLLEKAGSCMQETIASHSVQLGEVHQLDMDLGNWVEEVPGPEKSQLVACRRELGVAEYLLVTGLYRPAYSSLRLALELGFAGVHFSASEFERRKWLSDRYDFSMRIALDSQVGLLSEAFVKEFSKPASPHAPEFASLAQECYRHCSQFVHGKVFETARLPEQVLYSRAIVDDWCERAGSVGRCLLFLMYARYADDLDLTGKGYLEDGVIHHFGHLEGVRSHLGLAEPIP